MSVGETRYTFRVRLPQYFERGRTQLTYMPVYKDGRISAPASGTYTLKDENGATVVTGAVTVTDSVAQYSVTAATIPTTLALSDQWSEEWALTMADGTVRTKTRRAGLALRELLPGATFADLTARYSVIASLLPDEDPTGEQKRLDTWWTLYNRINATGRRAYVVLNSEDLVEPHLCLWAHRIFRDAKTSMGNGKYAEEAAESKEDYTQAWDALTLFLDEDEDGLADSEDAVNVTPPVFLSSPKW